MTAVADTGFYPPRVTPAPKPLRFPANFVKLLRNNIELVPDEAYERPIAFAPGPPRMAFITGPDLVRTLLLSRAGDFPKGGLQVDVLKPVFGNAMISVEGKEWRWQRGVAAHPKPSRFQFMPFGAGPRICIGASFAVIEATIMLATIVRAAHFDLAAGCTPEPVGRMFLVPRDGVRMHVTLR